MSRTFQTLFICSVSFALSVALTGCGQSRSEASPAPVAAEDRAVAVGTLALESRLVIDEAVLPADLAAKRRAALSTEIPGIVRRLAVKEGDTVRAGEPLILFDTRSLEQRVAEAEAVERQRRLQFERAQALLERRSITQIQFLDAQTARDVSAAQLASARLELQKMQLVAPWSGTVAELHPEVGDFVSPGQALVELVDVSTLEVRATAPSSDVPFLSEGLDAEVQVDAFADETFVGKVVRLATEVDPQSRTLEVVIEIDNASGKLRPGLAARVSIPRRALQDALLAPLEAVIELEQGHVVYVADQGRAAQRPVILGPVIGSRHVIIQDGLQAGEQLIVEGHRRLSPGQKVTVDPSTEDLSAPNTGAQNLSVDAES